jgi:hypothetical protein
MTTFCIAFYEYYLSAVAINVKGISGKNQHTTRGKTNIHIPETNIYRKQNINIAETNASLSELGSFFAVTV